MRSVFTLPVLVGAFAATSVAQPIADRHPVKPQTRASANVQPQPQSSFLASAGEDDCSTAANSPISGFGTFPIDSTAATTSPQVGAGCVAANLDVWFLYTATITGSIELNLCGGTTTDSVVAVWSGSTCPAGTPLACNDDSCGLQSRVTFAVTSGSQYLFQIGSFGVNPGYVGSFNVVPPPTPPANDDCATPTTITGTGLFPFDNAAATTGTEGQTEGPCAFFGSTATPKDIWYTWTAPLSGVATFSTCTLTTVDTKIAVYPGAGCPAAGSVLFCNDDSCASFQSSIEFPVTAGTTYTLQLGLYPFSITGGTGNFSINVQPPPGPPTLASLNVDIALGSGGAPSNAYAGAAAQPGFWNERDVLTSSTLLNDLSGNPCQAVLTRTGTSLLNFFFDNVGTSGDDQALMDDCQDVGATGGTTTWTFGNLFGGNYAVYTYAWAPDSATFLANVSVAGSTDPVQTVGGAWPGAHALGVTYALHLVTGVPNTGSIAITVSTNSGFASVNGFQIVRLGGGGGATAYCFGDGTGTACPCGNNGAAGNGCANSLNANGANLAASGVSSVSADTVVLTGSGMPNANCLYFQGLTQISTTFGDGLRCAGGTIIRLGTKTNVGGTSQYPTGGDLSVSVRGAVPPAGGTRTYQCWYRNAAAFCTASTFNLTNGVSIQWTP